MRLLCFGHGSRTVAVRLFSQLTETRGEISEFNCGSIDPVLWNHDGAERNTLIMICCIIGFVLITKFLYGVDIVRDVLHLSKPQKSFYDTREYCELDEYRD